MLEWTTQHRWTAAHDQTDGWRRPIGKRHYLSAAVAALLGLTISSQVPAATMVAGLDLQSAYLFQSALHVCRKPLNVDQRTLDVVDAEVKVLEDQTGISKGRLLIEKALAESKISDLAMAGRCIEFGLQSEYIKLQVHGYEEDPEAMPDVPSSASDEGEVLQSQSQLAQDNDRSSNSPVAIPSSRPSQAGDLSGGLPIPDGPYVRKQSFCDGLQKGELDMIDLEVEADGFSFSYPEAACVVSEVQKLSTDRYAVKGDCREFDELWQTSFFLDVLADGNIRIDGDEHFACLRKASVYDENPNIEQLIETWAGHNEDCRGGLGNDPRTHRACERRSESVEQLKNLRWCYGESEGLTRSEFEWKACESVRD